MWEVLIASGPVLVLLLLWPETSAATILHRRAARLRRQPGNDRIRTRAEIAHQHNPSAKDVVVEALLMPARITALDPAIPFTNVYMMLVYGIYYSFFESFPLVWGSIYGLDLLQSSLAFIPFIVGTSLALLSYTAYLYYYRVSQQFQSHRDGTNTNTTAPSNSRRKTDLPRASAPPSHGQLLPPADRNPHFRLDSQIRHPLDRPHDRSHDVPHGSLRHLPGPLSLPASNVPPVRRQLVCGGRYNAVRLRSRRDSFREASFPHSWHWLRLQFARGVDGSLHLWAVRALLLWSGSESDVEVCGGVLMSLVYISAASYSSQLDTGVSQFM